MSSTDFANWYVKENKGNEEALTKRQYLDLEAEILEFIQEEIIEKQGIFTFPNKVGSVFVKAYKSNLIGGKVFFRRKKDSPHRVRLKYPSLHNFGFYYKFKWVKSGGNLANKSTYIFKPVAGRFSGNGRYRLTRFLEASNYDLDLQVINK